MASDTSLVFNLVARDRASAALGQMKEKFSAASAAIGVGVAGALGAGVAQSLDMSAASDKLAAQLGVGPAEAAELSKVSAHVYSQAWGESTADVNDAIRGVYQQIGDTSQAQGGLEGVTTRVMALSETFDQDLGGTTAAVGQMIKTGLAKNADEALNILTRGFQTGADKAGDLLDTMNEYGTQFKKFGIDGQMATGLLSQGLKAGARDADLVADSIKEFSIRAIDGSTTTAAGFKAIGLNAKDMATKIGQGGTTATQALDLTLDRLRGIEDPVKRSAAATQLFGTQAEDLGSALYALDPSNAVSALGQVGGAADRMAKTVSDNPAAALETFKRTAVTKLAEIGGQFITFAQNNSQVMMPLAVTLGTIAGVVLAVRAGMMAWAAAQTLWSAATTIATAVQWAWNAALLANPITWIVIAIVALIAIIVLIATKTTWFQTAWSAAWGAIKGAAAAVGRWFTGTLWPWMRDVWNKITAGAGQMKDKIIGWWNAIVSWVTGIPGKIRSAASGMWDGIKDSFRSAINWLIGKWNGLSFGIPAITIPFVGTVGGGRFSVPQIPYLAKGGTITGAGMAMVGERGPEQVYLPQGASVVPLGRGGSAGGIARVVIDVTGADEEMKRLIRKIVKVDGRGSAQTAFG